MKVCLATAERIDGLVSIQLMPPARLEIPYGNSIIRPETSMSESELFYWIARKIDDDRNLYIKTLSMIVVDCFRLAVKQGDLPYENLEIKFVNEKRDGFILRVDRDGRYTTQLPVGYFDTHRKILRGLL